MECFGGLFDATIFLDFGGGDGRAGLSARVSTVPPHSIEGGLGPGPGLSGMLSLVLIFHCFRCWYFEGLGGVCSPYPPQDTITV
jgi:hypothetical protein